MHFGERFEFFFWPLQTSLHVSDVHLYDFFARPLPGVGNINRHLYGLVRANLLGIQCERTIVKGGIGETEAKGEQRRNFSLVVVAVANEQTFAVGYLAVF